MMAGEAPTCASAREGSQLPREVVVWLQSLHLSQTVKHPKRDLSNGFVVAEICSHYWPTAVPMHSFENKLSTRNKRSNWEVLAKVFAKQGVALSAKMIDGMVERKEQYAELFLQQLYTILTGREVRQAAPLPTAEVNMPSYTPRSFPQQTHTVTASTRDATRTYLTGRSAAGSPSLSRAGAVGGGGGGVADVAGAAMSAGAASGQREGAALRSLQSAQRSGEDGAGSAGRSYRPDSLQMRRLSQRPPPQQHPLAESSAAADVTTKGGSSGEAAANGAATSFGFEVRVRPSEQSTTVVDAPLRDEGGTAFLAGGGGASGPGGPSQGSGNLATSANGVRGGGAAGSAVEAHRRRSVCQHLEGAIPTNVKAGWRAAVDAMATPRYAASATVASPRYLLYFLQSEGTLDADVQASVWGALLTCADDVVQLVRKDAAQLKELFLTFLSSSSSSLTRHRRDPSADNEREGGDGNGSVTAAAAAGSGTHGSHALRHSSDSPDEAHVSAEPVRSPRVFAFLCTIMAQLTALDPYASLAALRTCVLPLPPVLHVLRRLDYGLAELYATLFSACVSTDRTTARQLLPDLLSAVFDSVVTTEDAVRTKVSYLVLLRAIVTRLAKVAKSSLYTSLPRSAGGSRGPRHRSARVRDGAFAGDGGGPADPHAAKDGGGSMEEGGADGEEGYEDEMAAADDDVHVVLYAISTSNARSALAHSDPSLRLAGAALTVTLLQADCPLRPLLLQVLPAVFSSLTPSPQFSVSGPPLLGVLQAMWLRHAQQRVVERLELSAASVMSHAQQQQQQSYTETMPIVAAGFRGEGDLPNSAQSGGPSSSSHTTTTAHPLPPTMVMFSGSGKSAVVDGDARGMLPVLLSLFRQCSAFLMQPGGQMTAKALVAYELACTLPWLPCHVRRRREDGESGESDSAQLHTAIAPAVQNESSPLSGGVAEGAALAVIHFFGQQATPNLVATAMSSASGSAEAVGGGVAGAASAASASSASGIVWHHTLFGPLGMPSMLQRTSPVLLCEAIHRVFASGDLPKDATRRLPARASLLAREKRVAEPLRRRVEWLYAVCIAGRAGGTGPRLPRSSPLLSPAEMLSKWYDVLQRSYDDIALLTMAAELRQRQHARAVDPEAAALLQLAGMAQRVVLCWYRELPADLHTPSAHSGGSEDGGRGHATERAASSSSAAGGGQANRDHSHASRRLSNDGTESPEQLAEAMAWYHGHFSQV